MMTTLSAGLQKSNPGAGSREHRTSGWNAINRRATSSVSKSSSPPLRPLLKPRNAEETLGKVISRGATLSSSQGRALTGGFMTQVEQNRLIASRSVESKSIERQKIPVKLPPRSKETRINGNKPTLSIAQSRPPEPFIARKETRILPPHRPIPARTKKKVIESAKSTKTSVQSSTSKRKSPELADRESEHEGWSSKRLRSGKSLAGDTWTDTIMYDSDTSLSDDHSEVIDDDFRDEGELYDVEKIIGEATGPQRHEYLVQWVGYQELDWIAAQDCFCPEKIADFKNVPRTKFLVAELAAEEAETERMKRMANVARNQRAMPAEMSFLSKELLLNESGTDLGRQLEAQLDSSIAATRKGSSSRDKSPIQAQSNPQLQQPKLLKLRSKSFNSPTRKENVKGHDIRNKLTDNMRVKAFERTERECSIGLPRSKRSNTAILPSKIASGTSASGWCNSADSVFRHIIHIRSESTPQTRPMVSLSDIEDHASNSLREKSHTVESWIADVTPIEDAEAKAGQDETEQVQIQENHEEVARPKRDEEAQKSCLQDTPSHEADTLKSEVTEQVHSEQIRSRDLFEDESNLAKKFLEEAEARIYQEKLIELAREEKVAEARRVIEEEEKRQALVLAQELAELSQAEVEVEDVGLDEMLDILAAVPKERQAAAKPHASRISELIVDTQSEPNSGCLCAPAVLKNEAAEEADKRQRLARHKLDRQLSNASAERYLNEGVWGRKKEAQERGAKGGQELRIARSAEKERTWKEVKMAIRPQLVSHVSSRQATKLIRLGCGDVVARSVEI